MKYFLLLLLSFSLQGSCEVTTTTSAAATTTVTTSTTIAATTTSKKATEATTLPFEIPEALSYYINVTGEIVIDGNITFPNGTVLTSDPWPEGLSNSKSQVFASASQVMATSVVYLYQLIGQYSHISANITGFRHGSIICDYVVAFRSLVQLTAEQVKVQLLKKVAQLESLMNAPPGLEDANVKSIGVSSVKVISMPSTSPTKAVATTKASNTVESSAKSAAAKHSYLWLSFSTTLLMNIFVYLPW